MNHTALSKKKITIFLVKAKVLHIIIENLCAIFSVHNLLCVHNSVHNYVHSIHNLHSLELCAPESVTGGIHDQRSCDDQST